MSDSPENEREIDPTAAHTPARARARDGSGAIERTASAILRVMLRSESVEAMMARAMSPHSITLKLMSEEGLTREQAERYQRAVRMRWERIGRSETAEQRLQRYRMIAESAIDEASRTVRKEYVGKDDDGKPLYEEVPRYDAKAVAALLAVLVKLEGEPPAPPAQELCAAPGPGDKPAIVVDRRELSAAISARLAKERE